MQGIEIAFWVCMFVGIGYAIVAFILGGIADMAGHFGDVGGAGGSFEHDYGVGGTGHGEAMSSHDAGGAVIFGPFSPLVIAFFLTVFGATGILLTRLAGLGVLFVLPLSAVSGFLLAWVLIVFFNRVLGSMQSSSEVRLYTLVDTEAEVTVGIPANGVGEIAYVAMGTRSVAPARSDDLVAIPRFSSVRISRIVGNMFFVRPLVEEQLTKLDAEVKAAADETPQGSAP